MWKLHTMHGTVKSLDKALVAPPRDDHGFSGSYQRVKLLCGRGAGADLAHPT